MEITGEELEKITADLATLAERKNLNRQLKESAGRAAELLMDKMAETKVNDDQLAEPDDLPDTDIIKVEVYIPGAPPQKIWMDRHSAENMAASFRQYNKPTFACNLPNMHMQFGGIWEVDLRQVACITSEGLKLTEEEPEEDYRPVSSYKNRSRSQGWRRGNVTCHNCGADYETDINEKWAYVKCKYCHESDTTVTYDD
ncbi:hypothetical protein ACTNDZ_00595 [Selenomonas montiformis]|uniref:hypothetical protein n=1 Tax=Selenomonas montiformis TaxID=2652285 RepID=UPI003F898896